MLEGTIATVFATLVTGTFQTGYAIALGCNDFVIGLLAGIGSFVGLLQLTAPSIMRAFPSRRNFVTLFSVIGRFMWLPMLLLPYCFEAKSDRVIGFLILTLLSSIMGTIPAATWIDWMSDLVPADTRGRYFGVRNLWAGLTGMLVSIVAGFFFDHIAKNTEWSAKTVHTAAETAAHNWAVIHASTPLFAFALLFALGSFILGRMSPDVADKRDPDERRSLIDMMRAPFADIKFRKLITFSVVMVISTGIAGQFFIVYMIQELRLTYTAIQMLNAVAAVFTMIGMPVLGYLADKYGNKPILMLSVSLCLLPPFLWCMTVPDPYPGLWGYQNGHLLISHSKLFIIALNIMAGFGWAGVGITSFNMVIGAAPVQDRTSYIGANSAICGIIGGVSPLIGGAILQALHGYSFPTTGLIRSNYHVLFLISGVLRFGILWTAAKIDEPESRSTRYVLGQLKASKPVGSFTAIQKLGRAGDSKTRQRAAEQLGKLKTPVAVEELVKALDDVSLPVREQAAASLGEIGDARAVQPLVTKLTDLASGIAPEAAIALGKIGHQSALPALAAVIQLGGPSPRRLAAIEALGRLQDHRVPDILIPMVPDRDAAVRIAVIRALATFPDAVREQKTVDCLLEQWNREIDATVLPALAEALATTGRPELAPKLLAAYDRIVSPVVEREILNTVGSLLGGQDSFYAYLVLEGDARDETIRKILTNLQKQYRKPAPTGNARIAVRIRQSLYEYLEGETNEAAINLYKAAILVQTGEESPTEPTSDPRLDVIASIAERAERGIAVAPEEVLLAVFVLRIMVEPNRR